MCKPLPVLVLLLLAGCRSRVPNLDSPGKTIVCLGDSITVGVVGKEYHVPVVEDAIGKILRDRGLKSDTVHPNAEGQKVLADAIADEIGPILKARARKLP